jgi:uncharacterized membrane protein
VGAVSATEEPTIGEWAIARDVSEWIEVIAIVIISLAVVIAIVLSIRAAIRVSAAAGQAVFKQEISRGLLIGLDLLIAADIIRTVTLEPTLENVAALGLLILVRTFLAWTLQLEADGRWPWQSKPTDPDAQRAAP